MAPRLGLFTVVFVVLNCSYVRGSSSRVLPLQMFVGKERVTNEAPMAGKHRLIVSIIRLDNAGVLHDHRIG